MRSNPDPVRDDSRDAAGTIGPREVLDAAPDLIFCCDARGHFVWASSTFEFFAGYRPAELLGRPFTVLLQSRDRRALVRAFASQLRSGRPQSGGDVTLVRRDGSHVDVTVRVRLYVRGGGDRYFVGVASERAAWNEAAAAAGDEAFAGLEARLRELQAQLDEVREGDHLKGEVLATLSREIRQPMDAVLSGSEVLMRANLTPELRTVVSGMRAASQSLISLVSDAYDHARLETGRMEIQRIDFDLRVTFGQLVAALGPQAASRGIEFDSRVDVRVPSHLRGDPGRLRQVLLNLGTSALKGADRGRVTLSAERDSEDESHVTVLFQLRDPGLGIDAERRARVFRDHREGAVPGRRGATAHLGLSIARRLVHLMGGLVGVEYEPDAGNTFWFRLTFEKRVSPAQVAPAGSVALEGLRVLVADGQADDRRECAAVLAAWGCDVTECENGIEALDRVRRACAESRPIQVAIADLALEGLDGEAFGSAVRADDALDETLLVMTTRLGRPGDADRARDLGFSAYLLRPIEPAQLFETLAELVAGEHAAMPPAERPLVTRHSLAEARRGRVRVLLVSDDPVNRLVTQSALNRVGFGVEVATSGRHALERTRDAHWDLVLMDLQMPDMDGLRATSAIRARERDGRRTPILGLSVGRVDEAERERCIAAGMNDVFGKPLDLSQLAEAAERWTGSQGGEMSSAGQGAGAPAPLSVVSARYEAAREEPAPELPDGPAIDLEQLNIASMGVPALRTSMLHAWLGDALPRLQRLEDAVATADAAQLEAESHGLRGMCASIGAIRCVMLFGEMERRAHEGRLASARALVPGAVEEVRRVEEFIARLERIVAREAA